MQYYTSHIAIVTDLNKKTYVKQPCDHKSLYLVDIKSSERQDL